ncbi:MAG: hypothetical protein FJ109_17575 [Deltaproteobacteria bacterium]|nr:hypothetical protein [Deltaproteobacteria bacterium]
MSEFLANLFRVLWNGLLLLFVHLWHASLVTLLILFLLFGPLILAALLSHFVSRRVEIRLSQLFGTGFYVYALGWLGTPLHELGHALMCVVFRHEIQEIRLFKPDRKTGLLGFVEHSYNPRSPYQQVGNFFIAIGPVLLGAGAILVLSRLLAGRFLAAPGGAMDDVAGLAEIPAAILWWVGEVVGGLKSFFLALTLDDWKTWLLLYAVLAIGSHVNLSPSDVASARVGFTILCLLLFFAVTLLSAVTDVPLGVFQVAGRGFGLLSSVILASTGLMMPVWLLLEGLGALLARK